MISLIEKSENVKNKEKLLKLMKSLKMEVVKKKSDVRFNEANTHHQNVSVDQYYFYYCCCYFSCYFFNN